MRVGSLVFATDQGLGVLAKSFYDAGVLTDVLVVRHGRRDTHNEWYANSHQLTNLRDPKQVFLAQDFCSQVDVMLFFETPFIWELIPYCRSRGVKTVLMPMYECMPERLPTIPDMFLCPSTLDQQIYSEHQAIHRAKVTYLPIPVSTNSWKKRETAKTYVHNAGNGGLLGRNGTRQLIDAVRHCKQPVKLILRSQKNIQRSWDVADERIDLRVGTAPYETLYDEGDVFVWPHKFDGLSLPLQEARAAGMLVMGVDRNPDNVWLPKEPLIPVDGYVKDRVSPRCMEFDSAIISPREIAKKMDEYYGRNISEYSEAGLQWANENNWNTLKPKYIELLAKV